MYPYEIVRFDNREYCVGKGAVELDVGVPTRMYNVEIRVHHGEGDVVEERQQHLRGRGRGGGWGGGAGGLAGMG